MRLCMTFEMSPSTGSIISTKSIACLHAGLLWACTLARTRTSTFAGQNEVAPPYNIYLDRPRCMVLYSPYNTTEGQIYF